MLAGRMSLPQITDTLRTRFDQNPNVATLVETKFDGERIQCHLQDLAVMFFSRNGKDYTRIYGQKLAGFIRENVKA
jgi:ATP-dependent DNA ligase